MTSEERNTICKSPMVFRGEVHKYHNMSGWNGYCVIVSGNHRAKDVYVSVISLKEADKDFRYQGDEVSLELPGGTYWCHCGMITYMRRDRIDEFVVKLSKKQMRDIDLAIMQEMGIEGGCWTNGKIV